MEKPTDDPIILDGARIHKERIRKEKMAEIEKEMKEYDKICPLIGKGEIFCSECKWGIKEKISPPPPTECQLLYYVYLMSEKLNFRR